MTQSALRADEQDGLHVAIIMDGNGRWARERGRRRESGHREGAKVVGRYRLSETAFRQELEKGNMFKLRSSC